jgi:AcrR family transcriptional regulator
MKSESAGSRNRGRPPVEIQRHVIEDLLKAAETTLAHKTAKEATVREIARAAGTNEAMVGYYFGSKNGLLTALFQDVMSKGPHTNAGKIITACTYQESIRPLIEQMHNYCRSRKSLIRMIALEMLADSSAIRDLYVDKYPGFTVSFISDVIREMIDQGIYDHTPNVDFFSISIMSNILMPTALLHPAASAIGSSPSKSSDWIDHIANNIDLALKPKSSS